MKNKTSLPFLLLLFILLINRGTFAQNLAYLPEIEADINLKKIENHPKAATLKALLIICDNYISPENNKIAQSVRVDMGTMTQLLGVLERRNVLKVEKTILQGNKATLANIRATLKAMQAGADDITLVYFSGHGGMEKGKTFLFTSDEQNLQRSEIESALNTKSNRLKIIITDACSNDVDGLAATRSLSKNNQQIEAGAFDPIYKDLFLGYQGMMHLSASTEGEYAWSNDNFGGFFTYHFVKEGLIKKPISDWQTIFKNAKDKTSQMFMRMPAEQRAELAKEGVKNQTAKAFSLPTFKTGGNIANNNNTNNNQTNNNTNPNNNNNLPNNNTNNNNNVPNNNTNTIGNTINNTKSGTILIENFSDRNVTFYIDNNPAGAVWSQANLKMMTVAASKTATINQGYAVVTFKQGKNDQYYELENGNYFFAIDETNKLDLFLRNDNINAQNYNTVAKTDFTRLLLGNWEWEDTGRGENVISTFRRNNTFTDQYPEESSEGTWSVSLETYEGQEYNILAVTIKQEDGSDLIIYYNILFEEEYPEEVQLVFVVAYENEKEIPYEEAAEFIQPTIYMYKTN
jgi:hypothetical protein